MFVGSTYAQPADRALEHLRGHVDRRFVANPNPHPSPPRTDASLKDELTARMPLAYVQLVQILSDGLILFTPFALVDSIGPFGVLPEPSPWRNCCNHCSHTLTGEIVFTPLALVGSIGPFGTVIYGGSSLLALT